MTLRRRIGRTAALVAASLATLMGCGACGEGCSESSVALVLRADHDVQRDRVGSLEVWEAAAAQDAIRMGEAVRTGPGASAQLELTVGGGLRMGSESLVRFGGQPGESPTLRWGRGEIEVDTDEALIVSTEFGSIRVERGSRLRAVYGEAGVRVEVIFGQAELGDGSLLTEGQVFDGRDPGRDAPELDSSSDAEAADAGPEAPPVAEGAGASGGPQEDADAEGEVTDGADGTEPGGEGDDELPTGPRVPGIAGYEFAVAAGAGGVVHHPSPPALVGINTGCADGEVTVDGGGVTTYTGGGTVGVRLGRGRARYQVRCAGQVTASGRFTVTGDAGRRRLNTRSQRHSVAADGRRYTFLYEGAMPTLVLRWNHAPEATEYVVSLTGTRRVTRLTSATPVATLPRSALRDGDMTFQFSGGGRQSPRTTVTLRYDTATPTANVDTPSDRGFAGGATVTVSGTAQVGSRVSVGGQQLEVNGRGAFSGTAAALTGGLAVRITTPNQGVHYFVRRSAGP